MESIVKGNRKIKKAMYQLLERQFNMETSEKHIFSEEYELKKQQLLSSLEERKKPKLEIWMKRISGMTAVVTAIVLLVSVGTYAAVKYLKKYNLYLKSGGNYEVDLVVEPDETNDDSETNETARYAKLNISYLPEGLIEMSGSDGTKYYFEGNVHMAGIVFQLFDVNTIKDKTVLNNFNVVSTDTFTINGNQVIFIKDDDAIEQAAGTDTYNKKMFIYFKEQNYLVKFQACSLISDEEMIKIGNGISITATDEADATLCSRWQYDNDMTVENDAVVDELPEEEIYIYNQGEEYIDKVLLGETGTEGDLTYRIDEIAISDSFDQIGDGVLNKNCYAFLDDTGCLVPNKIVYLKDGDGVNTLAEIVAEETLQQKVLYVTLTIRNDSDVDYENFVPRIQLAKMKVKDGNYKLVQYTKEIECDRVVSSASVIENNMVYYDYIDSNGVQGISVLKSGEERTLHVAFCINECDIPYLYLNTSIENGSIYFYENRFNKTQYELNYVKVQD